MAQQTLMLNIKGRATPYAYQVPEPTYERFKYLQAEEVDYEVIGHITQHVNDQVHQLETSIKDWEMTTRRELELHDRLETAREEVRSLFM